ncbi:MAG: serine--tRNA ligase, partial [Sediminibacterium sp.]|nr:serine--tRNA ligase [Sediminibacterium sp.]
MLQVSVLRNNPDWAKNRLMLKGFSQPELVDSIIVLDDQRKKTQNEFDLTQAQVNQASKQIGALMA